jgi:hypothetical protein
MAHWLLLISTRPAYLMRSVFPLVRSQSKINPVSLVYELDVPPITWSTDEDVEEFHILKFSASKCPPSLLFTVSTPPTVRNVRPDRKIFFAPPRVTLRLALEDPIHPDVPIGVGASLLSLSTDTTDTCAANEYVVLAASSSRLV